MTNLDYKILKAEIAADPLTLGYAAADNAGKADILRNHTATVQGPIPIPNVAIWAAQTGVMTKLQQHAANTADPLNSAAAALLVVVQGGYPTLDVTNPAVTGMLSAFIAAGDFTQQQAGALLAMGQTRQPRWQTLGLSEPPYEGHVADALANF